MAKKPTETIEIKPPNFKTIEVGIIGTAPLVLNKFSHKAKEMMKAKQEAGSQAKKKKEREPKDFQANYEAAKYVSRDGSVASEAPRLASGKPWLGIPAPSFRNAMISACRLVGFTMTIAKLAVFIEADGFDKDDGTPLVKIATGEPRYHESMVRNETGVADIRARPMWEEWTVNLRVRFDADMFSESDVVNLLARAGAQVGIGEGRPGSKNSNGMGWGTYRLAEK